MKKVLLTTTALTLAAGVASAEITLSGKTEAGVIRTGTTAGSAAVAAVPGVITTAEATASSNVDVVAGAVTNTIADSVATALANAEAALATAQARLAAGTGTTSAVTAAQATLTQAQADVAAIAGTAQKDAVAATSAADSFTVYSGIDINMAASATADNGYTFSIAADIGGGSIADVADKEIDAQGETIAAPTMTIGAGAYTVTVGNDAIDDYYDGDLSDYDLGVSGTTSGVNYGIAFNTEKGASSQWTATAGMDMGGVSLDVNANEVDGAENQVAIIAGYTMDTITLTLTNDNKGAAKDIGTMKIAYADGPMTASYAIKNDKDHASNTNSGGKQSWDITLGYTMGSATVSYSTNESSAWEADVAYDLGGANAFIATDSKSTVLAGVNFSF
jgi:hypothetical protein